MFFREALAECLAYIRLYPAAYSEAELRSGVTLPGKMEAWGAVLEGAASARALRSSALEGRASFLVGRFDRTVLDWEAVAWGRDFDLFTSARRAFLYSVPGEAAPEEFMTPEEFWNAKHGAQGPHSLLVFDPGGSLSDGAARVASGGSFDDDNIPPWDTWITLLLPLAEDTGSVNPEGCLCWASVEGGGPDPSPFPLAPGSVLGYTLPGWLR